jgi:hypothetical protein
MLAGVGIRPKAVLKEIHFSGELGLPVSELRDYAEYLSGSPMEQRRILEDVRSAFGKVSRIAPKPLQPKPCFEPFP